MPTNNLNIASLLDQLETAIRQQIQQRQLHNPVLIGIHSGGAWIAEQIYQRLGIQEPLGLLDITFYRDDFSQIGMHPKVKTSQLPTHLEGRDIILIDDVLYTGRTIRAALNELFDYGRPAKINLAALVDRGGRQLPVAADFCARTVTVDADQMLVLQKADDGQLTLTIDHA